MDPEYCWHTYASLSQSAAIGFCSEAIKTEGVTNHPKPLSVANVWTEDLESIRAGGCEVLTLKYVEGVRVCFDPLKCHILSFKTVVG